MPGAGVEVGELELAEASEGEELGLGGEQGVVVREEVEGFCEGFVVFVESGEMLGREELASVRVGVGCDEL